MSIAAEFGDQPAENATPRVRLSLAQKLIVGFLGLVAAVLIVNGAIDMALTFREARQQAVRVQQEKANGAAERVVQFVTEIEQQLGWTTRPDWAQASIDQRRYDFIRLLRQAQAITEIVHVDASGREQLKRSRLEPEQVGSNTDYSQDPRFIATMRDKVYYGPVSFRRGSEPYMTIGMAHGGRNPGATIADVNLKLAWDVVTGIRVGNTGYAFITDPAGRLIAHPDMNLVLRNSDLKALPQVKGALAGATGARQVTEGNGLDGSPVLSAHAGIPKVAWNLFVELPAAEALGPVWAALYRTLALLALGVVLAGLAGTLLARRLLVPIAELQAGAQRLGEGDLAQRIPVRTGDEIGALASRFNVMAERIQESQETLERRVEERTADLNDALKQQTTTSDILRVISQSPTDVMPVFDAIVEAAVRLLRTDRAFVMRTDGKTFTPVAGATAFGPIATKMPSHPVDSEQNFPSRVIVSKATLQIPDWSQIELPPDERTIQEEFGTCSALFLPLLRGDECVGVLAFTSSRRRELKAKEVALAESFRDQAMIAIENARLFEQVQTRTKELSQSLDDLRAAQDRLVQTEKLASLGQLTAGVAHEIKNPLNFVNNFADLSIELVGEIEDAVASAGTALPPKIKAEIDEVAVMLKGNLAKVVHHGRRADSIVKNMLAHSREGGGERRAIDLNATVEEALNLAYHGVRAEKPGFNITLERDYDATIGQVDLFPQEFTRVMLNLIGNGFYAANKKRLDGATMGFEPTLRVATRGHAENIEIKVRDNGTGIPDAVKARIFEPFFTTKPTGEGTGLGLSLSHDIVVKQHGGRLDVTTEPGHFTEFTIILPRKIIVAETRK